VIQSAATKSRTVIVCIEEGLALLNKKAATSSVITDCILPRDTIAYIPPWDPPAQYPTRYPEYLRVSDKKGLQQVSRLQENY
jgi:hypothetical protein